MSEVKTPLTLGEQGRLLDRLVGRCVMRGGELADTATITITKEDADDLHHLALRLERMAPHQSKIEKLVRYGN